MKKSIKEFKNIVILTGAGISAESGISTFRDSDGLWEKHRIEDVATPEAYERNPELVWRFYSMRRLQAAKAVPNAAHICLVEFAKNSKRHHVTLITQNVDGLHHRADPLNDLEPICMHGTLNESRCTNCGTIYFDDYAYFDLQGNYAPQETVLCNPTERASDKYLHHYNLDYKHFLPQSPCCKMPLRPHIVWFGEMPLEMDRIEDRLESCDLFVSIGTSGSVYPAAGFLQVSKLNGAHTVCINKEAIPHGQWIDEFLEGPATEVVLKYFHSQS